MQAKDFMLKHKYRIKSQFFPMIYKTLDVKLLSFTARKKWSKLLSATETYNRLDLKILKRGRQKLKKIPKQIENIKYNLSI